MAEIKCANTFETLMKKVKSIEFGIKLKKDPRELVNKKIEEFIELGKNGEIDENLSFEEIQALANALSTLYGDRTPRITAIELASNLLPGKDFGNSRELGVNGSLDSPLENYENTREEYVDFVEKVYQNSAVTSTMLRFFQNQTISKIMVDIASNSEVLGNRESLNEELRKLQNTLYEKIVTYIKTIDQNCDLPDELYNEAHESNLDKLTEYFKNSQNHELNLFYEHRHDPVTTLADWRNKMVIQEEGYKEKLEAYNSYFILRHFDSMLTKVFGSLILYVESQKNKMVYPEKKYKYNFDDDHNKIVSWQQEDLQSKGAFDLIPKSLQMFIESCELLNFDSDKKPGTGTYLNKDHLTYIISKIKNDFRSKEYNSKEVVSIKNPEGKSIQDIANSMVISSLIDKNKLTPEDKQQLAILLQSDTVMSVGGIKVLTFRDIINSIRHAPMQVTKLVFDLREAYKKDFPTDLEKRIFQNVKYYFFNEDQSLYSSSKRMYSQLAQLFDTTSILTYTQYKIDRDGSLALIRLNPARLSQEVRNLRKKINSRAVAGECDNLLSTYNVTSRHETVEGQQIRIVSFDISAWGRTLHFDYNPRIKSNMQRWSLTKIDSNGKKTTFNSENQETEKFTLLSDQDFNLLCQLARDVIGVDLYNNRELQVAYLNQFKSKHEAALSLINCVVPILANIKIFRERPVDIKFIDDVSNLQSDYPYTYRINRNGQYVNSKFYLTDDEKPYTKQNEKGEIVPDVDTIKSRTKGWLVPHLTREQVQNLIDEGAQIGKARDSGFKEDIVDWYADQYALRASSQYQGVDIVSDFVQKRLEPIVNANSLINGSTFKTQVRTAENTNITVGQSSILFTERFNRLEKYNTELVPMHVLYDELAGALDRYEISREGSNDTTQKQHKDFNFKENFWSSFVIDYFMPIYGGAKWNPRFTESVNSDKNSVPKFIIEATKILQSADASKKIHETLGDAYRLCFNNIESDFKKIQDTYNKAHGTNIVLSQENNFREFNQWCKSREKPISPLKQLQEMVLFYNTKNQNHPIAIAENIHYHVNRGSKNIEMVFSFIEALARYTIITNGEYQSRIKDLETRINSLTRNRKEKYRVERLLTSFKDSYKTISGQPGVSEWNKKIIDIIRSENTQAQLGLSYNEFKKRFITGESEPELRMAYAGGDPLKRPYNDFIHTSNLSFISDLLKNDVTIDLKDSETKDTQLYKHFDNVVRKLSEYSSQLKSDESNLEDILESFSKIWLTYNQDLLLRNKKIQPRHCDRMALGILEVYNPTTKKYEILYDTHTVEVQDENSKEKKLIKKTIKVPVQIASREDLAFIKAYDSTGKEVNYYDSSFDLSRLKLFYKGKEVRIKVNPLLEQYNLNTFYWTTLSTFATAGSHIWNDAKGGTNTLNEECLKWFDNNKRNVIMTATKLQFELGDTWGVPNEAKIAVIDDITAVCSGIMGDTPTVKPYDGATFVNAFMHYWENYSLNNQITGDTKKPIYEFYDERLMAGGLIKTATFAITNEMIRNSTWAARAMWKTSSLDWYINDTKVDDEHPIDLTLGLEYGNIGLQKTEVNGKKYNGPMYFEYKNGKRYINEIVGFRSLGKNEYEITLQITDPTTGKHTYDSYRTKITNNYTFWKVLGKYNSCEWNEKTEEYQYSENSIKIVADWAAKIKFRSNNGTLEQVKFGKTREEAVREQELHPDKFSFQKDSYGLRDTRLIYCPLKEANIHYLVTKGAIKKYAANINSKEEYFSDKALNFFKIKMLEAGIQLDPTHDADQSVVSMMTQVISALAERGYTHEQAQEVYLALGELTSLAIADGMKAFNTYFTTKDRADLQTVVSKLIVEEFAFGQTQHKGSNLAAAITQRLINEGIKGQTLQFKDTQGVYPFSDPSMFAILQTTITSALNKKAIKAQLFGTLAVLNPSHEIHKMLGQKRLSEMHTLADLENEQKYLETLNSLSQAEIGRTYQIILDDNERKKEALLNVSAEESLHGKLIQLKDSDYYYLWKYKLAGKKYTLKEIIYTTGDTFTGTLENVKNEILNTNNQFNFFNITSGDTQQFIRIDDVSELDKFINNPEQTISIQKINLYGRNLGSYNIHIKSDRGSFNRYDLKIVQDSVLFKISNKIKDYVRSLGQNLTTPIEDSEYWEGLLENLGVNPEKYELYKYVAKQLANIDTTLPDKNEAEKQLQKELLQISKHQTINVYNSNNELRTASVGGYSVKKFEAILPRIYATQFGLRKGDSVKNVLSDSYFFYDRMLENYVGTKAPATSMYDLCFRRNDGKHIYVLYSSDPENTNLLSMSKVAIDKYTDDNGTYRMDPYRNKTKLYPISNHSDQVFYDDVSECEVIVTNNLKFYVDNLNYTDINISRETNNQAVVEQAIRENKNKFICKQLTDRINAASGINNFIQNQEKLLNYIAEYVSRDSKRTKAEIDKDIQNTDKIFYNYIKGLSDKQRTAFKQSLEFTVARIPAQGMQSFMAMEIVGFHDSNVNDCFVSAEQIRLQGSDYDVDKATFMGFAFNKAGEFVKWSPFFQEKTISDLKISMNELPYPTGRRITIEEGDVNSINYSKYEKLFITRETKNEDDSEENFNNETNTFKQLKGFRNKSEQRLLAELIREVNAIVKEQTNKDNNITTVTLTYSDPSDKETAEAIQAIVNKHNLYIRRVSKEDKENLLKNFVSYKTLQISQNPANALAGETPVDESAQPFKDLADISPFGNKPEYSRPGNSAILFSALLQNQGGKDVISIAASLGLKTLHAVTQAYNDSIANKSDISNLWFNVEIVDPIDTSKNKSYHFLADAYLGIKTELPIEEQRTEAINRLTSKGLSYDQAVLLFNSYLNHREWAGSNESGILTLATDNAKELRLDRLNAGQDLAPVYLYGILIGMPREDIFKIMTSQTAQVLARITKGNLFIEPFRFLDSMKEAIKFLEKEPNLPKTIIALDKLQRIEALTPIEGMTYDGEDLKSLITFKNSSIKDTVVELTKQGKFDIYLRRLKLLQQRVQANEHAKELDRKQYADWISKTKGGLSYDEKSNRDTMLRLITYAGAIYEIIDNHIKITKNNNIIGNPWADLQNIKTLFMGQSELQNVNQLLSLNQGQRTKMDEVYAFYERFSGILQTKLRDNDMIKKGVLTQDAKQKLASVLIPELIESAGRVDFDKFIRDKNYQQAVIKVYDALKTQGTKSPSTINPYWVITTVPHFYQYLNAAHTIYLEANISIKNRAMINDIVPHINKTFSPNSKEASGYYSRALKFIDNLMANAFLREDKQIEIPAGNKIFKIDKETKKLIYQIFDHPVLIELGTQEGNETFRNWMNQVVIPGLLREGKLYDDSVKIRPINLQIQGVLGNKFIADLTPTYSNQTINRNNMMVYTLPIDTIPKSDTEIDQLSKYMVDFYKLNKEVYKVSDNVSYSLVDLFFYYNLINFQNRGGGGALTPLFEPFIRTKANTASTRYVKFISNLDTEYDFKMGRDYTEEMLNIALAPTTSEISMNRASEKRIPFILHSNNYTMQNELHSYNPKAIERIEEQEFEADIDPELRRKKTALERRGFILEGENIVGLTTYPTKELDISLENNGSKEIQLDFIKANVSIDISGNTVKRLRISDVRVDGVMNRKEILITGKNLDSYIKVTRDENGVYGFKINPISLLSKLQTLRRAC